MYFSVVSTKRCSRFQTPAIPLKGRRPLHRHSKMGFSKYCLELQKKKKKRMEWNYGKGDPYKFHLLKFEMHVVPYDEGSSKCALTQRINNTLLQLHPALLSHKLANQPGTFP